MANEKFTQLPTVSSAQSTDIIAAVQGSTSVQETLLQVSNLFLSLNILHYAGNPNGNVAGSVYKLCWDTTNHVMYVCTATGSSTTAVWTNAGSVTFPIPMSEGGTGKALTAANGGLVYTDASSMEILAPTATAGQIPRSGSNSAPSWSTSTYPSTVTANNLLYASAANTIAGLATTAAAVLTTVSSVPTWASTLSMALGGSSKSLTPSNGGVVYTDSDSMEVLSGTATAGQVLRSGSSSAPSWSTATYPDTTTSSQLLYSSSANTVSGLSSANSASIVTNSSGVPAWTASMTNGQVLIGSTGATPSPATLTAGTNISISNGAGSVTISATGSGGFSWVSTGATTVSMTVNTGYIVDSSSLTTFTLPTTSIPGDTLIVVGNSVTGWKIAQSAGQYIFIGNTVSTVGASGFIASTQGGDSVHLVCVTANLNWASVGGPQGNITIS